MKNKTITATLAALGAQVIFGFSFMSTKLALNFASPITVIADRYLVAFLGLTLVMFITKTKFKINKNIWKLFLMSFFQPVLYFLCESYGIEMTTSSFSSVMISLIPVVALFSGLLFLKEFPSKMQYAFTLLSVLGVCIMALVGKSEGTVTMPGVILLIGAVISSVAYNTLSRKISSEFSVMERTYAMAIIGMIVFLLISFVQNIHSPQEIVRHFLNPVYTLPILYLGVLSSVVAFLLLNYANTYLPVAKTTVFANVTTVVSVLAGIVFLKEKVTLLSVISILMIIVGVWGVQALSVKNQTKIESTISFEDK